MNSEAAHSEISKICMEGKITMKKMLPLLLAVLLLFTACAGPAVTEANKVGAVTYPGVDWLVSPENMMKILGKNSESFDTAVNDFTPAESRETYYVIETTLFGEAASVKFTFAPTLDGEDPLLMAVDVSFEKTDKETYDKLKTALEQEISRQAVAVDSQELLRQIFKNEDGSESREIVPADTEPFSNDAVGYTLTFTATSDLYTGDLPDDVQKATSEAALELGVIEKYIEGGMTYGETINLPLSITTLVYEEMENGEATIRLRFNANGYCSMMQLITE